MRLASLGFHRGVRKQLIMEKEDNYIKFYTSYPIITFSSPNEEDHYTTRTSVILLGKLLINDFLKGLYRIGALIKPRSNTPTHTIKSEFKKESILMEQSIMRDDEVFICVDEASAYFDIAEIIHFLVNEGIFQPIGNKEIPENKVCYIKPATDLNLERTKS